MDATIQELINALIEYDQTETIADLEEEAATLAARLVAIEDELEAIRVGKEAKKADILRLLALVSEDLGVPIPDPEVPPVDTTPNSPVGASVLPGEGSLKTSTGTWSLGLDGRITKDGQVLPESNSVTRLEVVAEGLWTTIRQYAWGTSWVYDPADAEADATGWVRLTDPVVPSPPPPPAPPPPAPPVDGAVQLTAFPTQPVVRWNYNQVYHPVEGSQPKFSAGFTLQFTNVVPSPAGELIHLLNETGGGAIKWELEKAARKTQGNYIVEATFDRIVPGVVYAPLWLYSEGAAEGGHEYDFEYVNGRLEFNLHNGSGGFNMKSVPWDLGGKRVRYEIDRRPGRVVMRATELASGRTEELVITPEVVAAWDAQPGGPVNLRMPADTIAMFPMTEFWRSNAPGWVGTWVPQSEPVRMTIHGYRFTA